MRECIEEGEERDVITEANLRLNVWLRTVSPPKRVHHRSNRDDLRPWNKQAGNSGSLNGKFRSRRFEDKWKVKETVAEEKDSGDQWRNMCQSTTTKKAVESTGPKNRGEETREKLKRIDKVRKCEEGVVVDVDSSNRKKNKSVPQMETERANTEGDTVAVEVRPDNSGMQCSNL
ncbi:hypothetical protein LWI28_019805 [Acer negundo]|uniref:Uncharacterized protein n=1 Tax=Acer negundo TaxID=4023 RepID=A0AAD5NKG4_ACENE|nr:hypothetical protein LWI28_019805 [Acer negundo]